MKQLYFRVMDPNGLHVRPSCMVAECLKKYHCDSFVEWGKKVVKGKDLVSIQKLQVPRDEIILFSLRGEQEEEAYEDLKMLLERLQGKDGVKVERNEKNENV